jgi:hypothetical protein
MIQLRHRQSSLCDAFWSEEVSDLWEPWMRVADRLLEDEVLLDCVYDAMRRQNGTSRVGHVAASRHRLKSCSACSC